MTSWKCEKCTITMDSDTFGEPETCPKCGQEMVQFYRKPIRMFGGRGVHDDHPGDIGPGAPGTGR